MVATSQHCITMAKEIVTIRLVLWSWPISHHLSAH